MQHRDARQEDLPQIVAIYNSTLPGRMVSADLDPISVESRRSWFADRDRTRHPIWVVERDGQIAACLSFEPYHSRIAYRATAEIAIYVHEDFRRAGFGRQLLGEAITQAPRLGLKTLLGRIFAHNEPSLRLFQSLGFIEWGELPNIAELDGVERSLKILGRRVG